MAESVRAVRHKLPQIANVIGHILGDANPEHLEDGGEVQLEFRGRTEKLGTSGEFDRLHFIGVVRQPFGQISACVDESFALVRPGDGSHDSGAVVFIAAGREIFGQAVKEAFEEFLVARPRLGIAGAEDIAPSESGFIGVVICGFVLWGYPSSPFDGYATINPLGQFVGAIIMFVGLGFIPGYLVAKILASVGMLRIPEKVEIAGLDLTATNLAAAELEEIEAAERAKA